MGLGGPDSAVIRQAQHALRDHLGYLGWLSERRTWLAGADFGLADLTAAAHLSSLDYMNDIPWDDFEAAKDWYMRLKSRPSFRPLLAEHVPGLPAPKHYAVLDF